MRELGESARRRDRVGEAVRVIPGNVRERARDFSVEKPRNHFVIVLSADEDGGGSVQVAQIQPSKYTQTVGERCSTQTGLGTAVDTPSARYSTSDSMAKSVWEIAEAALSQIKQAVAEASAEISPAQPAQDASNPGSP